MKIDREYFESLLLNLNIAQMKIREQITKPRTRNRASSLRINYYIHQTYLRGCIFPKQLLQKLRWLEGESVMALYTCSFVLAIIRMRSLNLLPFKHVDAKQLAH